MTLGITILSGIVIFDLHPLLNEALELLPLPDDLAYKFSFIAVMLVDFLICFFLENWKKIFRVYKL